MRRSRYLIGAVVLALVLTAAAGLRNVLILPVQRETSMALPNWPKGQAPLRVALVSDIHVGNFGMSQNRLSAVIARINAARPDLILLVGDFVNGHHPGDAANAVAQLAPLAGLKARLGVVAVMGNHDHWTDPELVEAGLKQAGITVLDNRAVAKGPITLIGLDDIITGHADTAAALASAGGLVGPRIVLSHAPDVTYDMPPGLPLLLTGHTHCGQIVLPLIGPIATHRMLTGGHGYIDKRYTCGVIHDPHHTVIITGGVGSGTVPVRFGAPPDFWIITLRGR